MFQFMTSTRIVFGDGALANSLSLINKFGYSALLICGSNTKRIDPVLHYLSLQNMRYQQVSIQGEPYIAMVEELAASARIFRPDMVIAMGGGSVIDVGKALAALIPNQGSVYDYAEVVGRNVPLQAKPLPFIAIPTTAGTGAEVTSNAVLRSAQEKVKVSMRSPEMLPDVAIVDPMLTYGLDKGLSGQGAMDAFCHLMEAYVCGQPNPITDMICEEGLRRLAGAIFPACEDDDRRARSDLSFAAMLGGMAVMNAKLGAAHGLASALGGKLDVPHSVITAELTPYVMQENIEVAKESGRSDILNRYRHLASIITGRHSATAEDGVLWVQRTLRRLALPPLSSYGLCETLFEEVADDALRSTAIQGNPLPLNQGRLIRILSHVCACAECYS